MNAQTNPVTFLSVDGSQGQIGGFYNHLYRFRQSSRWLRDGVEFGPASGAEKFPLQGSAMSIFSAIELQLQRSIRLGESFRAGQIKCVALRRLFAKWMKRHRDVER